MWVSGNMCDTYIREKINTVIRVKVGNLPSGKKRYRLWQSCIMPRKIRRDSLTVFGKHELTSMWLHTLRIESVVYWRFVATGSVDAQVSQTRG